MILPTTILAGEQPLISVQSHDLRSAIARAVIGEQIEIFVQHLLASRVKLGLSDASGDRLVTAVLLDLSFLLFPLAARFRNLDLAEDALAEANMRAAEAWLTRAARCRRSTSGRRCSS